MIKVSLRVLAIVALSATGLRGADAGLEIKTHDGVVRGKSEGQVSAFLGIPYAAPPVGALRWKPPQPPAPWSGVRDATQFGPRPMQPAVFGDMVFRDPGCSEDCLSLNVWTPAKRTPAKLPVMVWIFGGGYLAGGTSEQRQDGENLAAKGVVVVSMNYRLGVFGFLVHPDLIAESPQHAAGNYGFLDQVAALRWVHDNIAAFGGDPANVTIFGESAGSFSVSCLIASPLARGLFQKAIGESGAFFYSDTIKEKSLAQRAREDSARVTARTGRHTIAELRTEPAEQLLDEVTNAKDGADFSFGPAIDGYSLPEHIPTVFAQGKQNDVPLLAGWNRDEGGLALDTKTSAIGTFRDTAQKEFGPDAATFLRLYPSGTEAQAARSGAEFEADRFIVFSTWAWLEAQVNTGTKPVYRYRFDRAPPTDFYGQPRGAFHSAEILYVFGQFAAQPQVPWTDADRRASELMQTYWTNFARAGNPNGPGVIAWPTYGPTRWSVMHLDAIAEVQPDDTRSRYLFLAQHWGDVATKR